MSEDGSPALPKNDSKWINNPADIIAKGVENSGAVKRPSSPLLDYDRGAKRIKAVTDALLSGQQSFLPLNEAPVSREYIEYEGIQIYNPYLARVGPDGALVSTMLAAPDEMPDEIPSEGVEDPISESFGDDDDEDTQVVLVGEIELFGVIPATINIYRIVNELQPYTEILSFSENEVSLSTLLPTLRGSDFDSVALSKPRFCYSEVSFPELRQTGVYFESDVIFRGALQPVADILRDTFHQNVSSLHLSMYLGSKRDWLRPWTLAEFVLSGSLNGISVRVFDILEFTRLGIELPARADIDSSRSKTTWSFGFGFFGSLNLTVPGSVIPLQARYHLTKWNNSFSLDLTLKDDEWKEVFGIKGLNLTGVRLSASLNDLSNTSNVTFEVEAELLWNYTAVVITGVYSKEEYGLEAYVGNLNLQHLNSLFKQLSDTELDVFDHDVVVNSARLQINSNGLAISGQITINGYSSAKGLISISRDGLAISGGISNVSFQNFDLHEAQFDVFIGSKSKKASHRATRFSVIGNVSFAGINLKAGIFTEKGVAGGESRWAVYGEASGALRTSSICPELSGSFLDISLFNLAFVATNYSDGATVASYNVNRYPVSKGVQFCATVEDIPRLKDLLRGDVNGMVLRASYVNGTFKLSLISPAARTITFGNNVYTGPLRFEIQTGKENKLMLIADLNLKLESQPDPLSFNLCLSATTMEASASAEMLNDWSNPFNIGKNVIIRRGALQFGIVYATFFATGLPGEIGFAGELNIGNKLAAVAMKLSQNPKEQLLVAKVVDLGVVDLVKFASLIADRTLPEPDNFLHFINLDLYLSTGASIGQTFYPAGVSMKGDMLLFSKRAQFECTVGEAIRLHATIEAFSLGPLSVRGASGQDPIVDVELSSSKQSVLIDGAVSIWSASVAAHLRAEFLPSSSFDFWIEFRLSDLFILNLRVLLTGKVNFRDLKTLENTDLLVHASMEQHIMQHIMRELDEQLNSAEDANKKDWEEHIAKIAAEEAAFESDRSTAISNLEARRKLWHEKRDRVKGALETARSNAIESAKKLQKTVDEKEQTWKALVQGAELNREKVKSEVANAVRDAEGGLEFAKRNGDSIIQAAKDKLQEAKDALYQEFGDAVKNIKVAEQDISIVKNKINGIDADIAKIRQKWNDTPFWDIFALKSLEVQADIYKQKRVETVNGLLWRQRLLKMAQELIVSVAYKHAESLIEKARVGLEKAYPLKDAAIKFAEEKLKEATKSQEDLTDEAIKVLKEARTNSQELKAFNKAKEALKTGANLAQELTDNAQSAVDGLSKCKEFIEFDVAKSALEDAKNNVDRVEMAKNAAKATKGTKDLFAKLSKWVVEQAGKIFDVNFIEFDGSLKSLVADGPPLRMRIKGIVLDNQFDIEIVWKPHFNLVEFIKELFNRLWELIKKWGKELFD